MLLDLTSTASLNGDVARLLDEVAGVNRSIFIHFIDGLSSDYGDEIDWWVTSVASRNVYSSELFHHCCLVQLVRELIARKMSVSEILVDRRELYAVLQRILAENNCTIRLRLRINARDWFVRKLRPFYNFSAAIVRQTAQWSCAQFLRAKIQPAKEEKIILVGTFVYSNSFKSTYRDRHYPGMLEMLEPQALSRIFLLPTFYKIRNYFSVIRQLRRSNVQFLMKEDYLNILDYAFAIRHALRAWRFWRRSCVYDGVEIRELYNAGLYNGMGSNSTTDALLKFRLAKRLKDADVEVGLVVDWFENQEINHGLNAGFRKWYPEARCVGYQGFVASPLYLSMFPTSAEYKCAVIPNEVAVIGVGYADRVREFCPRIEVIVAPAFRYAYLWKTGIAQRKNIGNCFTIVVTLPMSNKESVNLVRMMRQILSPMCIKACGLDDSPRLVFKAHPAVSVDGLLGEPACQGLTKEDFLSASIFDVLRIADVVVSAASGTCMEAVVSGVPVLVIAGGTGPTFNPIPDRVSSLLWRICYSPDEILKGLSDIRMRSRDEFERLANDIRDHYFSPVTPDSVRAFLRLDNSFK